MNIDQLRSECARRGWAVVDEHGPDVGPDAFRIKLDGDNAEAACYRRAANWRVVFHGTMPELQAAWSVLEGCGVR